MIFFLHFLAIDLSGQVVMDGCCEQVFFKCPSVNALESYDVIKPTTMTASDKGGGFIILSKHQTCNISPIKLSVKANR